MNAGSNLLRQAHRANHGHSGNGQPDDAPNTSHTPRQHLSRAEMEELVPIKMQHAAAAFVIKHLKAANNGWTGVETEVGGEDDRRGIDFHLINRTQGIDIPVDFSTSSKGGFAVKLHYDWFRAEQDGTYSFLPQFSQALFRAFMPAMDPNNKWDLLGWKLAQKA